MKLLVTLATLSSLSAFAGPIEQKAWYDREIRLETMKLDPAARSLTMETDEGIKLSIACAERPRLLHPKRKFALTTRKVGDTTQECEAITESYMTEEECMNKVGALAQEFRGRPDYRVFNNIQSDIGMMCADKTDYVKQELDREGK